MCIWISTSWLFGFETFGRRHKLSPLLFSHVSYKNNYYNGFVVEHVMYVASKRKNFENNENKISTCKNWATLLLHISTPKLLKIASSATFWYACHTSLEPTLSSIFRSNLSLKIDNRKTPVALRSGLSSFIFREHHCSLKIHWMMKHGVYFKKYYLHLIEIF